MRSTPTASVDPPRRQRLGLRLRREAPEPARYAEWLTGVVTGSELALAVPTGVVRVVTSPRIVTDPAPTPLALRFVDVLHAAPRARGGDRDLGDLGAFQGYR